MNNVDPQQSTTPSVIVYTDGAAEPNPGPGGFGAVLIFGKHRKELSGGFRRTTNNRMELMGVIAALEELTRPCSVQIYSDSKYVVDSVQRGSLARWAKANWQRAPGQPVKNIDLWKRYLEAANHHRIKFHWVKGHAGVTENERCDVLAVAAAKSGDLTVDQGYLDAIKDEAKTAPHYLSSPAIKSPQSGAVSHKPHATQPAGSSSGQPIEGGPCRKCGGILQKRPTKQKTLKPNQTYYYEWFLFCSSCGTMYMVNEAKRIVS
jgi:ribonuclease HI